jgi:hypothetical protein
MTPASSLSLQSCRPQPRDGHLHTWDSFPVHFRSSSQMGPDPAPKWADLVALRVSPQPSCLHTTRASSRSQPSSQMVPQEPSSRISTLPAQGPPPSTRRSCLLSEEREMGQWGGDLRGWVASSVLWDSHLSSRGRSPLRPQSLLVQTRSRCTGAAPGSGFLQKQQWSGVWLGWRTGNWIKLNNNLVMVFEMKAVTAVKLL